MASRYLDRQETPYLDDDVFVQCGIPFEHCATSLCDINASILKS